MRTKLCIFISALMLMTACIFISLVISALCVIFGYKLSGRTRRSA